jgi:hypothetical protein
MGSSISAARLALDDMLTVAAADNTSVLFEVQTTFGTPLEDEEQEVVAILGISDPSEATETLGPEARRRELYRIELTVKVYDPTAGSEPADRRAVDARCFALADAVRSVVEADTTLAGTVNTAHVVNQRSDGLAHPFDAAGKRLPGWVVHVDMSIACRARA